jgi:NAD(P)-dependent dehydrogenase (short-subunit alcohol dehydrogenase family)
VRLAGKKTVITGAAGGMGRVACRRFLDEGASVIAVDLADGSALEEELAGRDFAFVGCDVSSSADVAALAREVEARFSGLDILFNNAGIILARPFLETTDEEWDRVQNVNLRGTFFVMRALVPLMAGRQASIVNMASGLGLIGSERLAAYSASKGGVVLLTKSAALELGPDIRVNAICPGVIDTPMPFSGLAGLPAEESAAILHEWETMHVAGRLGRPEEVIAAAVFLASDEASFVTGSAMTVDSGVTAR